MKDLIGNSGSIDNIYKWLKDWNDVIIKGRKKKIEWRGPFCETPNLNSRAAMLGGPPGIGKTSCARIVCA